MRGAVAVSADVGGITFDTGEEALRRYRFNTGAAQHYFCSRCGIYTHHRRRSQPEPVWGQCRVLKGREPFDFADVPMIDGVNHPADHGRGYRRPFCRGRSSGELLRVTDGWRRQPRPWCARLRMATHSSSALLQTRSTLRYTKSLVSISAATSRRLLASPACRTS
jgi:hypothetical protein